MKLSFNRIFGFLVFMETVCDFDTTPTFSACLELPPDVCISPCLNKGFRPTHAKCYCDHSEEALMQGISSKPLGHQAWDIPKNFNPEELTRQPPTVPTPL
ncbi:hypothetical protein Anapl_12098 [Anas platyrhynchos]|uniref:Uncharacterized protein n=1 Tax=Anas platyrhynchos TaxID=8839 RepID=R0LC56_ANAPL|nr:hypothetical protein Anapl_12098 [Anas platyrhynchos]